MQKLNQKLTDPNFSHYKLTTKYSEYAVMGTKGGSGYSFGRFLFSSKDRPLWIDVAYSYVSDNSGIENILKEKVYQRIINSAQRF